MTDVATVKTVEFADPSPVPESNWFWRRLYVFVVTCALAIHIGWMTLTQIKDEKILREVIRNDQGLIMLFALLYLAGASAEAIGGIIAAIRTSRKETTTTATPAAALPEAAAAAGDDPTQFGGPRP